MRVVGDTTREARRAQLEVYRRMGGPVRIALACEMSEDVRVLSDAGARHRSGQSAHRDGGPSTTPARHR